MVRRSWLAVALILICACMWAQTDSLFVIPRVIQSGSVEIPQNWQYSYTKTDILIEVKIYPDSSVGFVSLKDPRVELIPLIEQAVLNLKYSPLMEQGKAVESTMLITMPLILPAPEEVDAAQITVSREYIDQWIDDEMRRYNVFRPILENREVSVQPPEIYRQGYHFIGRNSEQYKLSNNGFERGGTVFGQALYLGYWEGFNRMSRQGNVLDFTTPIYEQPVTLTNIQASLGDYEFKYARGSLKKNYLFGIKDFYYSMDFLVQNGYWTDVISDQTSVKHFMRLPVEKFDIRFTYEDYAQNIAMIQLNPVYWRNSIYRIDHIYKQISLDVLNPYLAVSLTDISESAKAAQFAHSIDRNVQQIKLSKAVSYGSVSANVAYTKAFVDDTFELTANYYDRDFKDLLYGDISLKSEMFTQTLTINSYDFNRNDWMSTTALQTAWGRYGIVGNYQQGGAKSFDETCSIYSATDTLRSVNINMDYSLGVFYQKQFREDLQIGVTGGFKGWTNNFPVNTNGTYSNLEQSEDVPFAEANLAWQHTMGDYQFEWQQHLTWQQDQTILRELPQYRLNTYLNLRRNLPYNNALFAGAGLTGHSSYLSQNSIIGQIQESTVLDVWAGLQITRMFEFTVSMKNVTDTTIYGIYPLPQSFHASLRWFYLN